MSNIFIKNKYRRIYLAIIKKAKSANRIRLPRSHSEYVYYENHHILPKCKSMFPKYKNLQKHPWNGVLLTAKEHVICHRLLTKFTKGEAKRSMIFALKMSMCENNNQSGERYIIPARKYAELKEEFSKNMSTLHKGKVVSSETRKRIGEASINRIPPTKGKSLEEFHGVEKANAIKAKISKKNKGRKLTEDQRRKRIGKNSGIKNGMFNKTHSEEVKQAQSVRAKKQFSGKSYEELYGVEKANKLRAQRKETSTLFAKNRNYNGSNNPNAKPVVVNGRSYPTMKEAQSKLKISRTELLEMLKS